MLPQLVSLIFIKNKLESIIELIIDIFVDGTIFNV